MSELDDGGCPDEHEVAAVRYLVEHPDQVGRASGRDGSVREALRWLTRGRWPCTHDRPYVPRLGTPWQDTTSPGRPGWRCRGAYLPRTDEGVFDEDEEAVFEVDYRTCPDCRIGWVQQPYTLPRYQRNGLARAGMAALRAEHPGLSWHTLGRHLAEGHAFWIAAGQDVPGSYEPRTLCPHAPFG